MTGLTLDPRPRSSCAQLTVKRGRRKRLKPINSRKEKGEINASLSTLSQNKMSRKNEKGKGMKEKMRRMKKQTGDLSKKEPSKPRWEEGKDAVVANQNLEREGKKRKVTN